MTKQKEFFINLFSIFPFSFSVFFGRVFDPNSNFLKHSHPILGSSKCVSTFRSRNEPFIIRNASLCFPNSEIPDPNTASSNDKAYSISSEYFKAKSSLQEIVEPKNTKSSINANTSVVLAIFLTALITSIASVCLTLYLVKHKLTKMSSSSLDRNMMNRSEVGSYKLNRDDNNEILTKLNQLIRFTNRRFMGLVKTSKETSSQEDSNQHTSQDILKPVSVECSSRNHSPVSAESPITTASSSLIESSSNSNSPNNQQMNSCLNYANLDRTLLSSSSTHTATTDETSSNFVTSKYFHGPSQSKVKHYKKSGGKEKANLLMNGTKMNVDL
jgi:hypothetical protein